MNIDTLASDNDRVHTLNKLMKPQIDLHVLLGIVMALMVGNTWAQGGAASSTKTATAKDPCKRDVLQYQSNIELVRKSLGDKAVNELAAKFMSKAEWDAMLLSDGYCGIAWQLHMKKLK